MLKRIITLLLAVAMLLSVCALAGCKNGPKGPVSGSGSTGTSAEEEFFMEMPSELRGTTVKFATWIDHASTDTSICLEGFEETTGMKYEMVQVNQHDYINKLMSLVGSDQAPDVVVENGDFPKTLNVLMPLEKETTGLDVKDPFWNQEVNQVYTVGKYTYLVNGVNSTWSMASAMTYFNKTILAENGITNPNELKEQDRWNVDTMWTLMEQIKSACGLTRPGTSIVFDDWLAMYGGHQMKWDPKANKFVSTITSDEVREAVDYLKEAQEADLIRIFDNHDDSLELGWSVLQICGAYGLRNSPGWFYKMDVDDLGFEVLPKVHEEDEDYPYNSKARAYGICKGSKNPYGAAYFLRYFLNGEHYDMDTMFKNEEAKQMYIHLRDNQDYSKLSLAAGIIHVSNATGTANTLVKDLLEGTSAQISVNLAKSSNQCEAAVEAANKLIDKIISEQ